MTTDLDPALLTKELATATWKSASSGGQTCVEVAFLAEGLVALRDSKRPAQPPLVFSDAEYDAFTAGIMRGGLRRNC
jgi:hypothetical protein